MDPGITTTTDAGHQQRSLSNTTKNAADHMPPLTLIYTHCMYIELAKISTVLKEELLSTSLSLSLLVLEWTKDLTYFLHISIGNRHKLGSFRMEIPILVLLSNFTNWVLVYLYDLWSTLQNISYCEKLKRKLVILAWQEPFRRWIVPTLKIQVPACVTIGVVCIHTHNTYEEY